MPVTVKKMGGRFRVVDTNGSVAKNLAGTAVDGKGHGSKEKAAAQARAINANLRKKGKI